MKGPPPGFWSYSSIYLYTVPRSAGLCAKPVAYLSFFLDTIFWIEVLFAFRTAQGYPAEIKEIRLHFVPEVNVGLLGLDEGVAL